MHIEPPNATLSVNDQSLVIKWGSRIVVPEDEELQTLLISESHDSKYAGHFGMSRTRVAMGRMFWWKQGTSPSFFLPV
jgi:hypothetical protein